MLAAKLLSGMGEEEKLYVDDVFSAYTYTGNDSTQTINNGIDLLGKGGLVWTKGRSTPYDHRLIDTTRGTTQALTTNNIAAQISTTTDFSSFSSTGYALGTPASTGHYNSSGATYVSWTFRKAPKFFDVVTYTGNGVDGRQIPHKLGIAPGMVIVKRTDGAGDWFVWHRGLSTQNALYLNATNAQTPIGIDWSPSATTFTVTTQITSNTSGQTYVAYLFAHDPSADGIVQCGSFTTTSGNTINPVTLGWEPQFVLWKQATGSTAWFVADVSRGWDASGNSQQLGPNSSNTEAADTAFARPNATGFSGGTAAASATYIYLAIRRPNKPPTTGTQVYNAIARTGTGAAATVTGVGFAPDLVITLERPYSYQDAVYFSDKLRGYPLLLLDSKRPSIEYDPGLPASWGMGGLNLTNGSLNHPTPYVHYFFRRAPGFMDVVCYTGNGVSGRTVSHSLGVVPELMIVKRRSASDSWAVYPNNAGQHLLLEQTAGNSGTGLFWNSTSPTASVFSIGNNSLVNTSAATYVAYLFASLPGISKVGSYTGNGTTQTINCGFSTGARFILIKRTDSTGDWYVWDTARGIISANDPHLSLNTTAAEVTTDDSVDPDVSGFIVNQVAATNINVSGGQYIYFSVA